VLCACDLSPQYRQVSESDSSQWQKAAAAWHRWGPALEEWLGEATELMLDPERTPRTRTHQTEAA